jgi:hypothetical protein
MSMRISFVHQEGTIWCKPLLVFGHWPRLGHSLYCGCMHAREANQHQDAPPAGTDVEIPPEWLAEFDAARRRPLATRFRYAFIRTYKPVLDDAPFRAFETTADYRHWCEENLPSWLGYGRV